MFDAMDQWKMDISAAFAHTISADFSNPRHMSAGVAVKFRRKWGKPIASDYVSEKLTCQKIRNGAVVYSLVTKPIYYTKPSSQDYDSAFKQLTNDFKKRGLKTLVCSPMGCVRDMIRIEHFMANLLEFQRSTEATIYIISYYQASSRVLRNGLSHPQFLSALKSAASKIGGLECTRTADLTQNDESTLPPPCNEDQEDGDASQPDGISLEPETQTPLVNRPSPSQPHLTPQNCNLNSSLNHLVNLT